jgi:hypothetical protein
MAAPNSNKPDVGDLLVVIRELLLYPACLDANASSCVLLSVAMKTGCSTAALAARCRQGQWLTLPASQTTSKPAVPTS